MHLDRDWLLSWTGLGRKVLWAAPGLCPAGERHCLDTCKWFSNGSGGVAVWAWAEWGVTGGRVLGAPVVGFLQGCPSFGAVSKGRVCLLGGVWRRRGGSM